MRNLLSLTYPYSDIVKKLDKEIQELTQLKAATISEFLRKSGIPGEQEWTLVGDGTGLVNLGGFECRKPHIEPKPIKEEGTT